MPAHARWLTTLLILPFLAGCAMRSQFPESGDNPLVSSLQVQTTAEAVQFVLQVTNAGTTPVELTFSSGQQYDFAVLQDGREVWRWSADRSFTMAMRSEVLGAGETRTYAERWSPPAGMRGPLTAVGRLTAQGLAVEQRASFTLP